MFSNDKDMQVLTGKYRLVATILIVPINLVFVFYLANLIGYENILGIKTANFSLLPNQFRLPHIVAITIGSLFLLNSLYFYLAIRSSLALVVILNSTLYCAYSFTMWVLNGPNIFYLFGVIVFPLLSYIILYTKNRKAVAEDENKKEAEPDGEEDEVEQN